MSAGGEARAWDPFVRIAHWTLFVGFGAAIFSGADGDKGVGAVVHAAAGYVVGAALIARIVWTFLPRRTIPRAARRANRAMAVSLLLCLAATVATGLYLSAQDGRGPLAPFVQQVARPQQRPPVTGVPGIRRELQPDQFFDDRRPPSAVLTAHRRLSTLTIWLVVLHVGGVVAMSVVRRENLIKAMITGR